MNKRIKPLIIRITTVPLSLKILLKGQHRFMSEQGFDVLGVSSGGKELQDVSRIENVRVKEVEMTRTISPIKDIISLWRFFRLCRSEKPDIVHSHTPKAGIIGMLGAKLAGVPIRFHTVAGLPLMETSGIKRKILILVERITYACASKVYPNSNNLKEFIIKENFCRPLKLKVIGNGSSNGINTHEFIRNGETDAASKEIRLKYHVDATHFTYVFIGRLVRDKGIEELVDAFKVLSQSYPQLKLLLVGPMEQELDPLSPECLEEIEHNSSIIAVGYQSDVKPYLALSNVLVFPSYREGFPNVPMQAGCFDLPSIVTNINGCNEIIIDGENGLIIPVKDQMALRDAMERLYLDTNLFAKLKSNARRMIVERYEQEKVWHLILEEYNTQLKSKSIV